MLVVFAACLLNYVGSTYARDTFTVTLDTEGQSGSRGFDRIEDAQDIVLDDGLRSLVNAYTETSQANIVMDVRGLPINVNFDENSTALEFSVPSLNFRRTFTGNNRDESSDELYEFWKKNGDGLLSQMLKKMVETTPVDPVAGNPASLMGQMTSTSFAQGTGGFSGSGGEDSPENAVGLGMRFGRYSANGFEQKVYDIPLSYTAFFDDPRYQLKVDLPLAYTDTGGSKTATASFGLGLTFPMAKRWSLTPAIRAGAVGSPDMASAAVIYSGSLTSNYDMYWNGVKVSIGNMGGYFKTVPLKYRDYEIDYDLSNVVLKNGLGAEGSAGFSLGKHAFSWQASVANTLFLGDALFVDNYWDFGVSLGSRNVPNSQGLWNHVRVGFTYTVGNNGYGGGRVNFGYTF